MNTPNAVLMQHYGTETVFQEKQAGAESLLARLAAGLGSYALAKSNNRVNRKHEMQAAAMNEMLREVELAKIDTAAQLLRSSPYPRFIPGVGMMSPMTTSMPARDIPQGSIDGAQWDRDYNDGMDEGMVRMASIAARAGADMAKEAGLGGFADFMKSIAPALKGAGQTAATAAGSLAKAPGVASAAGGAGGLLSKGKDLLGGKMGLGWKGNLALTGLAAGGLMLGNKGIQKATQVMGEEAGGPAVYGAGRHGYQLPMGVNQYGQPQLGTPL